MKNINLLKILARTILILLFPFLPRGFPPYSSYQKRILLVSYISSWSWYTHSLTAALDQLRVIVSSGQHS